MIKSILIYAVLKIKKRNLVLDESISNAFIFNLCRRQLFSFIRGIIKFKKLISVGPYGTFNCTSNIECDSGVTLGSHLTMDGLGGEGIYIGSGSSIGSFSVIKVSGTLTDLGKGIYIGTNVGIGDFAHIGGAGGVEIGDDTIIGSNFSVHPENHNFQDKTELIRLQGITRQGIKVGNNCWIGAKVTLLDGCDIGNGSVVAAGSVARGVFPDNVIIGGVPARIIKER